MKKIPVFLYSILLVFIIVLCVSRPLNTIELFSLREPMDIYVINLDKDQDRLKHFMSNAKRAKLAVSRIPAVEGAKLDLKSHDIQTRFNTKKFNRSQLGCALSHLKILEKIKDKPGMTLIMEDDALIPPNFSKLFNKYYKELPDNWDIFYLGGNRITGKKISDKILKPKPGAFGNWGMFAYIVKNSSAGKILADCSYLTTPIDNLLRKKLFTKLNAYFAIPPIITHNYGHLSNTSGRIVLSYEKKKREKIYYTDNV